jgi:predicted dehydrogenase
MNEKPLQTAVLGLDERGMLFTDALSQSTLFKLQAVADKDTQLAEKTAEKYKCMFYDDYRQLVIQNQFDCLIVAAGMHSCDEYVRAAMKKKFNILKLSPPARNFEEAREFVNLAEEQNIRFCVGNSLRCSQSFNALQEYLRSKMPEQIFMICVNWIAGNLSYPTWQSDWKLSGGGVIIRNCYELVDQILCNFPVPEQVYMLYTNQARDKQQRSYLTEDTALMTMKFSDSLMASITASKSFGPEQKFMKIYSRDKILTASETKFTVTDHDGNIVRDTDYADSSLRQAKILVENFALGILTPDKNRLCSFAADNLNNMAVIESAYLSARTGMPEEPARIMQMATRQMGKSVDI